MGEGERSNQLEGAAYIATLITAVPIVVGGIYQVARASLALGLAILVIPAMSAVIVQSLRKADRGNYQLDYTEVEWAKTRLRDEANRVWVSGYLARTLLDSPHIALEGKPRADRVDPRQLSSMMLTSDERSLASQTDLRAVFEESGRSLLLCGVAGSGKTTTLLELLGALQGDWVKVDACPVVLNLSNFHSGNYSSFRDWLIHQVEERYQLRRDISEHLSQSKSIYLFLDGIDEIPKERHRVRFVQEFSAYWQTNPIPVVITTRSEAYDRLPVRLNLNAAYEIQALSIEQVRDYLANLIPKSKTSKTVHDAVLDAPLELEGGPPLTPLLAKAVSTSLGHLEIGEILAQLQDPAVAMREVMGSYVESLLHAHRIEPQSDPGRLSADVIAGFLHWLATSLYRLGEGTTFFPQRLGPDWLPDESQRVRCAHRRTRNFIAWGVIVGSVLGAVIGVLGAISQSGLVLGVLAGAVGGLTVSRLRMTRVTGYAAIAATVGFESFFLGLFGYAGIVVAGVAGGVVAGSIFGWAVGKGAGRGGLLPVAKMVWRYAELRAKFWSMLLIAAVACALGSVRGREAAVASFVVAFFAVAGAAGLAEIPSAASEFDFGQMYRRSVIQSTRSGLFYGFAVSIMSLTLGLSLGAPIRILMFGAVPLLISTALFGGIGLLPLISWRSVERILVEEAVAPSGVDAMLRACSARGLLLDSGSSARFAHPLVLEFFRSSAVASTPTI